MKIAVTVARTLLGLIFLIFGLHFFLHFSFIPSAPPPTGAAGAFQMGLYGSGYFFQFLKAVEVVSGLMLLINRFAALFVLVLLPVIINIALFHLILMPIPMSIGMVIVILISEIFLIYAYRKYYMSILTVSSKVE